MSWSLCLNNPWRCTAFASWVIFWSWSWCSFSIWFRLRLSLRIWSRTVFMTLPFTSLMPMSSFWIIPIFKSTCTLLIGWIWRNWLGIGLLSWHDYNKVKKNSGQLEMSHSFKTKYCDQKDTKMKVLRFRKIQDIHLLSLEHSCHPFLAFSVLCLNQLSNQNENDPSASFQKSKCEENIWNHKSRLDFVPSAKVLPSPERKNCLGCFLMFLDVCWNFANLQ